MWFISLVNCRCTDFSKRTAKCDILLWTRYASWEMTIDYSIVSTSVFKKIHTPLPASIRSDESKDWNPGVFNKVENTKSYSDISSKLNITQRYADMYSECITMEATLPLCTPSDCQGHFYDIPYLPHLVMCFQNTNLLRKVIFVFTGRNDHFKHTDFGQEYGIQILS